MSQTAIVAGGCFWGMESRFQKLAGILKTEVGFTGGNFDEPTYRQVCQDITGHVEAVKLEFDPAIISYAEVLDDFFNFHDPTLCRDNCMSQSSQYGSVIFPLNEEQKAIATKVLAKVKSNGRFSCEVDTKIKEASTFWPAEDYHQSYYKKHNLSEDENHWC